MTNQNIQEIIDKVAEGDCEGDCTRHGGHSGECELCEVAGFGYFSYCATAQTIDEENGLAVEPVEECSTCEGEGTVLDYNKFILDEGEWKRSFDETVSIECPDCQGYRYQI